MPAADKPPALRATSEREALWDNLCPPKSKIEIVEQTKEAMEELLDGKRHTEE